MIKSFLLSASLCLSGSLSAQPRVGTSAHVHSLTALLSQLDQISQTALGRVSVAATLLETGESVALHGREHYPMQSVYKFPIGMTVLHQVDGGKLTLDQVIHVDKSEYISAAQHSPIRDKFPVGTVLSVSELLRYAVSESDGSASDALLRLVGGAAVVRQYLKSLNINDINVLDTEMAIGRDNAVQYKNWAQPVAFVRLLQAFQQGRGLTSASRAVLMRLMTETQTGLKRLKGLLPPGTVVVHKTGGSGTANGLTAATNDVGLITLPNGHHLAIAVFISDSKADTATREAAIAQIALALWEHWQ